MERRVTAERTAGVIRTGAGATRRERHQSRRRGRQVQKWKRREEGREAPPGNVSMTFLTNVIKKGCTEEEILAVLVESEKDRKRRRMLAIVTETVDAHRLQKMRDLLTFEKLATWRRMNGFDRVADGEENWFHGPRSLPCTPEEYTASLRSDLQELKDATSMPRQKVSNLINAVEQGKVTDEGFATLKRLVEKRSHEAAQAQVTVTPVDTVQYGTPARKLLNHRQMYVLSWRTTRVRWTRS